MTTDPRPTVAAFSSGEDGITAFVKQDARGFLVFLRDDDAQEDVGFVKRFPPELRAAAIAFAAQCAGFAITTGSAS